MGRDFGVAVWAQWLLRKILRNEIKNEIKNELKNYGFHKNIKNYQNLMNIYKTLEPLSKEQAYGISRIAMIVPNNYKEICLEDQKQLSKPYWTYNDGLAHRKNC